MEETGDFFEIDTHYIQCSSVYTHLTVQACYNFLPKYQVQHHLAMSDGSINRNVTS